MHVCVHVNACGPHVAGELNGKPSVKDLLGSLEYGPAPESPAVAEAWLDDHGRSLGHFIGNQWIKPEGRKTYDTFNPATGQRLAATIQGIYMGGGWPQHGGGGGGGGEGHHTVFQGKGAS